jgi:natural product biosynthesis luciferase-like monooxygenase protein
MTAEQYIGELVDRGIELWVEDGKLRYRGSWQAMTDDVLAEMARRKPQLIAALEQSRSRNGAAAIGTAAAPISGAIEFSMLFFAGNAAEQADDQYRLLTEAARFADQHDFAAIWLPERHFHAFGGLYPNPSVLAAALAMITSRIRLRAGSVVLPLQDPIRVAEEWAVVDNLSAGRVDLAFAQGRNARDFVLAPTSYDDRLNRLFDGIKVVQRLWRGEAIERIDGAGRPVEVRIYPKPRQQQVTAWLTCSGTAERFAEAGAIGANILTALLFQTEEELAEKIAAYRQARVDHGFSPDSGHVTLMMHTFIGRRIADVKSTVRGPFVEYLRSSMDVWRQQMQDLDDLEPSEREDVLAYAFERYFETAALFGTADTCLSTVNRMRAIGVNEIACLMDFGVGTEIVLANLPNLDDLRRRANAGIPALADVKMSSRYRLSGAG